MALTINKPKPSPSGLLEERTLEGESAMLPPLSETISLALSSFFDSAIEIKG